MKIGIIGSGTMGAGIAQVAAQSGNQVIVVDTQEAIIIKAKNNLLHSLKKLQEKGKISEDQAQQILYNISWELNMENLAGADMVIEAIVEKLDVKQLLCKELEKVVSSTCILGSNTSSLSVTSIASACTHPERVIGIHFFNPATVMELVEIVPALQTAESAITESTRIIKSWNKKVVIAKDTPGFIVNRIARPFYSEAIRMYEEGFASLETIDYAMKSLGGFRMGPFELMDLIGHDINYTVTETVWTAFYFDQRFTPSFTQKRLVEANWLGKKTGKGFYDYADNAIKKEPQTEHEDLLKDIFQRVLVMLINEAANAKYLNIANQDDIEMAMTKGVNYPKGLLHWADEWGISNCVEKLDRLYAEYHEDRYRCCPLLRSMQKDQTQFFSPTI